MNWWAGSLGPFESKGEDTKFPGSMSAQLWHMGAGEGAQFLVSDRLQVVRVCDHARVVVAGVGIEVVTRWVILAGPVIGVAG